MSRESLELFGRFINRYRPGALTAGILLVAAAVVPAATASGQPAHAAVKATALAPVTIPLASSGSNSLCVNPVGVNWGDGSAPPATLATNFSNANGNCVPAGPNTAIAQGPPGTDPCHSPAAPLAGASWVGIDPTGGCSDGANPPGPNNNKFYIYDTEFPLPACADNLSISGSMLADNAAAVYLNQYSIGAQSSLNGGPMSNFTLPATPFSHAGPTFFDLGTTNVLDFLVLDHTTPQTGLDFSATVTYTPCAGVLKICKVAGFGVPVGQSVSFTMTPAPASGSSTISVPAGPAPGGYCKIAGNFAANSDVTVTESVPSGDSVASINVAPPAQQVGPANLGTGTVEVAIGSGVTEATYTNVNNLAEQNSGYLEICKQAIIAEPWNHLLGANPVFAFTIGAQSAGGAHTQSQTVNVLGNTCSPAIQVLTGPVTVTETLSKIWNMVGCGVTNGGALTACSLTGASATVTIPPGNVSQEAILTITNSGHIPVIRGNPCLNCVVAFAGAIQVGDSDIGTGTVIGDAGRGSPTGTMRFYECGPTTTPQPCTSRANPVGSAVTLIPGTGNTSTATSVPFWPGTAGYWCFAEYYSGSEEYPASSDTTTDGCFDASLPPVTDQGS